MVCGEARSLGVDAVPGVMTDLDREWLTRKLKMYDIYPKGGIDHIKKIVAGKQLWNYDNLEPGEKSSCCDEDLKNMAKKKKSKTVAARKATAVKP